MRAHNADKESHHQFHSDAEDGLGPRVASLSLGSSAHMHFRLLKKYRKDTGGGKKCNALTLFLRHVCWHLLCILCKLVMMPRAMFSSWTGPRFNNTTSVSIVGSKLT